MAPNDVTPCDKKQTNQHTVETLSIQCYGWIESWLLGLYPWCFLNFVVLFDLTDFLVVSVFQLRAGLLRGRQMLWGPAICREPGRVGNNAISCSIIYYYECCVGGRGGPLPLKMVEGRTEGILTYLTSWKVWQGEKVIAFSHLMYVFLVFQKLWGKTF